MILGESASNFLEFKDWLMVGGIGIIVMGLLNELRRLRESVEKLNVSVAIMITQQTDIQRRVERLEQIHVKPN